MIPVIFGLSGPALTAPERAFFRAADPTGFILFARNCVDSAQLSRLTADLRDTIGRDCPMLIDQEGGRVSRLRPPAWPAFPAAARFGELYAKAPLSGTQAAYQNGLALAALLRGVGINVDCAPVLDVPQPGAHDIIGDRAYAADTMWIAALGRATLDGLHAGGVSGVIKHLPGHGRARADSHLELPVVDASLADLESSDFEPFRTLAARARIGMTAHIVYPALDPTTCASLSATVIARTIRGYIGFAGLLLSDDLDMAALTGDFATRTRGVLAAGCDIALHCGAAMDRMEAVAGAAPATLSAETAQRLAAALPAPAPMPDAAIAAAHRDALLALA